MRALPWVELESDPPDTYIEFVAQHLTGLRRDVLRAVDDAYRAQRLYPEVLTDMALAWPRLESARLHGRPDAAGAYLDRCLHRRVFGPIEEEESEAPRVEVSFMVWDAASSALPNLPPAHRENAAVRLAGQILPVVEAEPAPLAEAFIAWWHAYEQRRRWRYIVAAVLGLALILFPLATTSTAGATF